MTTHLRRLPRSNIPRAGESLASYLVNLAYRLGLRPDDLITRTGLKTGTRPALLDLTYVMTLPADLRQRFCATTGLTDDEARALTLDSIPALAPDNSPTPTHTNNTALARTAHANHWIDIGRTRYCPNCLADTPTYDPDHATWKLDWATPWTVACTHHRRLLLDSCPTCATPTGEPGRGFRSAIPNIHHPLTHPAACRAIHPTLPGRLCNTRLDHVTAPEAPDELIELQQRLMDALYDVGHEPAGQHDGHQLHGSDPAGDQYRPDTLGTPVTSDQWLRDLRITVIGLHLARHTTIFDQLDDPYRDAAVRAVEQRTKELRSGLRTNRILTQPPTDTTAMAGILLTADTLLADPGRLDDLNRLSRQAHTHEQQPWKKVLATLQPSIGLDHALKDLRNGLIDPRKLRAYTNSRTYDYGPTHIPAYLDRHLFERHFGDIAKRAARPTRRCVPIAIIRLLTDWDTITAGDYLGYNRTLTEAATARTSDGFDDLGQNELRRRIATIAIELEHNPRVDYRHRRNHFAPTWTIPDQLWEQFRHTLVAERLARTDTPWQRRRPAYDAWVWSIITSGDINLAPMIQTTTTGRLSTNGVAKDISDLVRRTPARHHEHVHGLATTIAATIDE